MKQKLRIRKGNFLSGKTFEWDLTKDKGPENFKKSTQTPTDNQWDREMNNLKNPELLSRFSPQEIYFLFLLETWYFYFIF